jgi:hypothetical protein
MTGRKTGSAYYVREGTVYAADPRTKVSRALAKVPAHGSVVTVNADETGNGQWIYLFRPEMVPDRTHGALPNAAALIQPGVPRATIGRDSRGKHG